MGALLRGRGPSGLVHLQYRDDLVHLLTPGSLMAVLDKSGRPFTSAFNVPDRRQGLLPWQQAAPALDIIIIPEEELQRFGVVFNMEEVVHEVVERARLVFL